MSKKTTKNRGIKFAYQLVVTFGHITFRRAARVFPILTGPLHRQGAVAAEGVDQAGCTSQCITGVISERQRMFDICIIQLTHMGLFSTTVAPLNMNKFF